MPCPHGNCTYRVPTACVYHGHTVTVHLVWALYLCTVATRTVAVGPRYTDTVPIWYRYGGHTGTEISCFALKSLAPGISPTHPTSAAPAVMTEHRRQSVSSSVAFHRTQRGGTVAVYRVHTANVHTVWPRCACTVATATVGTVLARCPCTVATWRPYTPCSHGVCILRQHGNHTYGVCTVFVYHSCTVTVRTHCCHTVCTITVQAPCQHSVYLPWGHITLALWQHGTYGHRWIVYPGTVLTQHTWRLCGHRKRAHCHGVDTHPCPAVDSSGTHSTSGTHFRYLAYPVLTSITLHTFRSPSCLILSSPCIHIR